MWLNTQVSVSHPWHQVHRETSVSPTVLTFAYLDYADFHFPLLFGLPVWGSSSPVLSLSVLIPWAELLCWWQATTRFSIINLWISRHWQSLIRHYPISNIAWNIPLNLLLQIAYDKYMFYFKIYVLFIIHGFCLQSYDLSACYNVLVFQEWQNCQYSI